MRIDIISLFPKLIDCIKENGIGGKAVEKGIVTVKLWNPRDYCRDSYQSVDDRPYGGGPGMVMRYEPLKAVIQAARRDRADSAKLVYLSPQGRRLDHDSVMQLASRSGMILLAGRYEGIDQRILDAEVDEEWSIGDYVLSGGELAAMVMIDAVTRWQSGSLGHADSAQQDSFVNGLLDWPHYTRPESIDDRGVPEVLLSGDHKAVAEWRNKQALGMTWLKRPDLLRQRKLTEEEQRLLESFQQDYKRDSESS